MTIDGLKHWLDAKPFKRFTMRLTDGRRVRVHHPELLARSPSGRTVLVYSTGDFFEMVDLLHVVSITPANAKRETRSGNGRKPKP